MRMPTGRAVTCKATVFMENPPLRLQEGKRVEGNMVSSFLYSLTYQHVTIILFEQTLTPSGQRERAS